MEVFKAFTALSLVDMISGPLGRVQAAMQGTDAALGGLGLRMGKLAAAMLPAALGAGALLGVFGVCSARAMAFESAMADVAKVIEFETAGELRAMGEAVKDLAGRLPMAQEGIAAIIAAAGQSGVAKADLLEFAEQAAKMGIAFDLTGDQAGRMMADWRAGMGLTLPRVYALADAVNHLSNNMNATAPALGEVIQRAGALAMQSGLAETQVASLGAAFLSAGASPEIAGTALKKFVGVLSRSEAMSKRAEEGFTSLGLSVTQLAKDMQTDAQGTIFKVMRALADKPKEMRIGLLTQMFGEESIGAIAPLLANLGNLTQAFDLVGGTAGYAGSMQAEFEARSKTTANALQLMSNRIGNLAMSVGTIFLPAIAWAADKLGALAGALRHVVDSPLGQWLLKIAGALSAAVIGVTAFSGAMWGVSKLAPIVASAMAPLKAAILGLGWPVLALAAGIGLLYAAYKTNFGGMTDTLDRWYGNISLIFRGVQAVFASLQGTTGRVSGQLARDIRAAGLVSAVTTVGKIIYRLGLVLDGVKAGFKEMWGIVHAWFVRPLELAGLAVIFCIKKLAGLAGVFSDFFAAGGPANIAGWQYLGQVIGWVGGALLGGRILLAAYRTTMLGAAAVTKVWAAAQWLMNASLLACPLTWIVLAIAALAAGARLLITHWEEVKTFFSDLWDSLVNFWDSIDLAASGAKLIDTLIDGIKGKAGALWDSVKGVFQGIRDLLPFSDAKEGPFSQLTLSGAKLMTTLAEGVRGQAGTLEKSVFGALRDAGAGIGGWWKGLFAAEAKITPELPLPAAAEDPAQGRGRGMAGQGKNYTFHIAGITLPGVRNGRDFWRELENSVSDYDGGLPV